MNESSCHYCVGEISVDPSGMYNVLHNLILL